MNLGSAISWLRIGLCAAQVGHQEAWMATKIGLPTFCAAAKASGVKASVSVANAGAAKAAVAATAASSAERRESMVEVLLAFNVVVLQRALVARSHKLPRDASTLGQLAASFLRAASSGATARPGLVRRGWVRDRLLSGRPLENCSVVIGRNFDQH